MSLDKKYICAIISNHEPWIYYNKYKHFLYEIDHPFKDKIDFIHKDKLSEKLTELKKYNAIGFFHFDPLKILYPEEYAFAKKIEEFCLSNQKYMINRPEGQSNSVKSKQLSILKENGFNAAFHLKFGSIQEVSVVPPSNFPIFIRYDAGHDSLSKFIYGPYHSFKEILVGFKEETAIKDIDHFAGRIALQFIDTRDTVDGLYRLYRVFSTTKRAVTGNVLISSKWYVHRPDSLQTKSAGLEDKNFCERNLTQRENDFFSSIIKTLGLEFGAIDFSYTNNKEIIIWEVNPNPALPRWTEKDIFKIKLTNLISDHYQYIAEQSMQ